MKLFNTLYCTAASPFVVLGAIVGLVYVVMITPFLYGVSIAIKAVRDAK